MSAPHTPLSYPPEERSLILNAYRGLLRTFKALSVKDSQMIRAAFELAVEAHSQQRRKNGEPYILHPIEVARICVEEIGLGPTAVVCALLHDVVEDTVVTLDELREKFSENKSVAVIVDGLTKLDSLHDSESPQAQNLAKVLRYMLVDVRVVLIKMADRLHNLRTIKHMPHIKQLKIAAETSSIYAPLAHRLGLHEIKTEFEDICLKITHREEFEEIARKLAETKEDREAYIKAFIEPLEKSFDELGFPYRITSRPKSIFSIWNKIKTKHVKFEDIYDLFAVRIIFDTPIPQEKGAAWMIYTAVTDPYRPIPERLKDWITTPKANGYQSLHTTVFGPDGRRVEVQIRSKRMDEIAERGFAAHWKYKGVANPEQFDNWFNVVRETLENADATNPVELLADFQGNLFAEEIHVYTPKGDLKILPEGATALDFAFAIHSDVGCRCQSAKIGGKLVPISEKLKTGDEVEIITNKNQHPSDDWLKIAFTSKARTRIKAALKEEKRKAADFGREILERKLSHFKVPLEENLPFLIKAFGFSDPLNFLSAIYFEQVDLGQIKQHEIVGNRFVEKPSEPVLPSPKPTKKATVKDGVILNNDPSTAYHYIFAHCCNPVFGDPIFAYLKGGASAAVIHRERCPNAENLYSQYAHRVLKAEWAKTAHGNFVADLIIKGQDLGVGVIQRLTDKISTNLGLNISSFSIQGVGGYFEGRMSIVVANTDQLAQAIRLLREVEGVASVLRGE